MKETKADPNLISYVEKGWVPKQALWIIYAMMAVIFCILMLSILRII